MNQSSTNDPLIGGGGADSGPELPADAPAGPQRVLAPLSSLRLSRGQAVELITDQAALILDVVVHGQAFIVFLDGQVRSLSGGLLAAEITDLPTILTLTRQALDHIIATDRDAAARVGELEVEATQARRAHEARLAEIRAYAIERYRRHDLSRPGLDEFLAQFNLGAYRPRVVTFIVTGRFELDPAEGQSPHQVENQVRDQLLIDTTEIGGVVTGSVDFHITAALTHGDSK